MNKILLLALIGLTLTFAQNCQQGELQINGACRRCTYIPGCAQYSASGACAVCQFSYQLVEGRCAYTEKPISDCCILTDENGLCQQCAPGLILDGNSCIKIERPGCLEARGTVCTNCADGYQNINGRCIRAIVGCSDYSAQGVCTACSAGFEIIRGLCSPIPALPAIPNCKFGNEYGCVSCNEGFFLTREKVCRQNEPGCVKHYREVCQLCLPGFKLVNGKCLIQGCQEQTTEGCTRCSSPYVLSQGRCFIENCLEAQNGSCLVCSNEFRIKDGRCVRPIAEQCSTCANGFFVGPDGRCFKNIEGCANYTNDGKCSRCSSLFTLIDGSCIIPGCQRADSSGCQSCARPFVVSSGRCVLPNCNDANFATRTCRSCAQGFFVQGGVCVKNAELCRSYVFRDSDQVCSACVSDDYILNENSICVQRIPGCVYQSGRCISCASPFRRGSDNSTCIIEGCSKYSWTGCTTCNTPYVLNKGACVIQFCEEVRNGRCNRCSNGYRVSSTGICIVQDPNCVAFNNDQCTGCSAGFRLANDSSCVREIAFCRTYRGSQCETCQNGYQLINGACVLTDKFCVLFDANGRGCTRCVAGYRTVSGTCRVVDPNCAQYEQGTLTQRCLRCASGFVITADGLGCIRQIPGCIYDEKGVCSSCRAPFTFNGKNCVIYACSKFSETGCFECDFPFKLDGNKCVVPFCDAYDNNTVACSRCQSGYKLIQGQCYREDPRCVDYNKNGVCTSCVKQFVIFEGVCVKQDPFCVTYSKNGGCNKCKAGYYTSPDLVCLPEEPGCIYQGGKCALCNFPFKFNQQAQKCRIDGCLEATSSGCNKCRQPFQKTSTGVCEIPNCASTKDNACARCTPGYHLKQGLFCVKNDISCLRYNDDGDCELCDKGYMQMSSGECELAEDNCVEQKKNGQCVTCKDGYFVNTFFQCQKKDVNCEQYNNGVCIKCTRRFFLYDMICFPYSPGCVTYSGKDCTKCKASWTLQNGECFSLKKPSLKLEGEDEKYDFEITPIDITKSKYYIDNLSPVSKLGKCFYSSFFSGEFTDPRLSSEEENIFTKGWKAQNARSGEYIGYIIDEDEPVTFFAIQIEGVDGNYIKEFFIEYSVDGTNYIRVETPFNCEASGKNLTTIYFTGLYAKAIRIVVRNYFGWPSTKIEFFYYDYLRFRKISNLKSLKYLQQSIQSNFVDRMDNQMYINQRAFFTPAKTCANTDVCFTGLELCQERTINSISVSFTGGSLKKVYVTYSLDGKNFNCFEKCRQVVLDEKQTSNLIILDHLLARNIRVYPVEYTGTPSIRMTYDYI